MKKNKLIIKIITSFIVLKNGLTFSLEIHL